MEENREGKEYLDNETGEENKAEVQVRQPSTDAETGEPEINERICRRNFQVPIGYLQQQQQQQQQQCHHQEKVKRKPKPRGRRAIHGFYWRKQEIRSNIIKEFLIFKRRNVGPFVFMLPTFFICPAWASILCLLGEACMHIWSHRRNWKRQNANIEYRSPFHLISSQFCVHCRSQKWMEKISQIQDKRNLRRRILYPNFRGKAVQ